MAKKTISLNKAPKELGDIDFAKLNDPAVYEAYQKIVASLNADDEYDFVLYYATPVLKWTINEDNGEKEQVLKGIKLTSSAPVHTSRITMKIAADLNAQIVLGNVSPRNSKYYLLKQAK